MDRGHLILMMIFVVVYFAILAVAILDYIFTSLGLYTIAKCRNLKAPWLAWIPVASCWTVGNIAADYDQKSGYRRKWDVALLVSTAITVAGLMLVYVAMFMIMLNIFARAGRAEIEEYIPVLIVVYVILFVVIFAAMATQILQSISLYKVFESSAPEKALKYILLSALVPLACGICLMKCKKREQEKLQAMYGYVPNVQYGQNNQGNTNNQ